MDTGQTEPVNSHLVTSVRWRHKPMLQPQRRPKEAAGKWVQTTHSDLRLPFDTVGLICRADSAYSPSKTNVSTVNNQYLSVSDNLSFLKFSWAVSGRSSSWLHWKRCVNWKESREYNKAQKSLGCLMKWRQAAREVVLQEWAVCDPMRSSEHCQWIIVNADMLIASYPWLLSCIKCFGWTIFQGGSFSGHHYSMRQVP